MPLDAVMAEYKDEVQSDDENYLQALDAFGNHIEHKYPVLHKERKNR